MVAAVATAAGVTPRLMAAAASAGPLRGRSALLKVRSFSPRLREGAAGPRRYLLTGTILQKPKVQVKEEGQPETVDYRVFFLDPSGTKISLCLSQKHSVEQVTGKE